VRLEWARPLVMVLEAAREEIGGGNDPGEKGGGLRVVLGSELWPSASEKVKMVNQ
jgi:hypothetical protein